MLPVFYFIFNYRPWPNIVKPFIIRAELVSRRPTMWGEKEGWRRQGLSLPHSPVLSGQSRPCLLLDSCDRPLPH
jgi:hypothetical protein